MPGRCGENGRLGAERGSKNEGPGGSWDSVAAGQCRAGRSPGPAARRSLRAGVAGGRSESPSTGSRTGEGDKNHVNSGQGRGVGVCVILAEGAIGGTPVGLAACFEREVFSDNSYGCIREHSSEQGFTLRFPTPQPGNIHL